MLSQEQQILGHLLSGNKITPLEALNKFGCLRLGARIFNIERKRNYKVQREIIEVNGKRFCQYWIDAKDRKAA